MIGLRKLNDMVMMNWMPTMAHSVVCQCEDGPACCSVVIARGAAVAGHDPARQSSAKCVLG